MSDVYEQLAIKINQTYGKKFPQAGDLMNHVIGMVEGISEIITLSGRRTQFNLYEPYGGKGPALPYDKAFENYGPKIKVANAYKGLNYLLQGSAADVLKYGLRDAWNSGIFDRIGVPHILVHDELDISVIPEMKEDILELKDIMENAVQLHVPIIIDMELGTNWGNVRKWE